MFKYAEWSRHVKGSHVLSTRVCWVSGYGGLGCAWQGPLMKQVGEQGTGRFDGRLHIIIIENMSQYSE